MKNIILNAFIIAILILQACKNGSNKDNRETIVPATPVIDSSLYLITSQSMGKIKLGITRAEVLSLYPYAKEDTVILEAEMPALTVFDMDGSKLFSATIEEDKVIGLITSNPKMKTAKGIQTGSLYPLLKENFKDLEFSNSEGLFAFSKSANLLFSIEGEVTFKIKNDEVTNEVESVSPGVMVTGIYIN